MTLREVKRRASPTFIKQIGGHRWFTMSAVFEGDLTHQD
jgi:hypothetical protein